MVKHTNSEEVFIEDDPLSSDDEELEDTENVNPNEHCLGTGASKDDCFIEDSQPPSLPARPASANQSFINSFPTAAVGRFLERLFPSE